MNGNPHDNRWSNLREVSHAENMRNQKVYSSSKTGIPGVHWHPAVKAWQARIQIDGVSYDLGRFSKLEGAIFARRNAETKLGFVNYQYGKGA
jgi:hypothetical protein